MEKNKTISDDKLFESAAAAATVNKKGFTVQEIVFTAICAAAGLLTSAVMPLVAHVPIYGIIQVVVSVQTSLFLSLALYKVRKRGTVLFFAVCYAIIQLFMAPVMFFMSIIAAAVIELIALAVKEGFRSNTMRYLASVLFIPVQMPVLWVYYKALTKELPEAYVGSSIGRVILMIVAVAALNVLGTVLGNLIGRELEKAGVLKEKKKNA